MILALTVAVALQGAPVLKQAVAEEATVSLQGDKIHYVGELTRKGVDQVAALLEANSDVNTLAINSGGGEIGMGIDLGLLVHQHQLDVHVTDGICMSSCANYVFPAGRRKVIEPRTVVVWHGSAIQEGLFDFDKINMAFFRDAYGRDMNWIERAVFRWKAWKYARMVKHRQRDFYQLIGVDPEVTVYGQLRGCKCQWTFLPTDMATFGIDNVTAYPGYGTPGGNATFTEWKLLKVQDDNEVSVP
ncbi:MAG: hypothetical protein IAE66_01825 [Xanthomonadaceae bacterium]|nr:hypothetical protein [Xanthomonadaceae bacterium]